MSTRRWMICAILVTVLANAGCVTCCHKGYQRSLENGAEYEVPTPCRGQVHVIMMHGLTPSTASGLNTLRLKLGENGFAKIGMAELYSALWVKSEIECIRRHNPDARFVLVGYDFGGAAAISLARDLTATGVPVDALVLIDPMGCAADPCGVPTLLVMSARATTSVPHSETIVVPDASHFGLPAHPTTVAAITELLKDIAVQNCQPSVEAVPVWNYQHAPEARQTPTRKPGDWDFLADKPGPTRAIGTQVVAQPTAPTTSAAPVVLKR